VKRRNRKHCPSKTQKKKRRGDALENIEPTVTEERKTKYRMAMEILLKWGIKIYKEKDWEIAGNRDQKKEL